MCFPPCKRRISPAWQWLVSPVAAESCAQDLSPALSSPAAAESKHVSSLSQSNRLLKNHILGGGSPLNRILWVSLSENLGTTD